MVKSDNVTGNDLSEISETIENEFRQMAGKNLLIVGARGFWAITSLSRCSTGTKVCRARTGSD